MHRIKKIRNQSSAEVNKYKGRLTGAGIVYDEKFAHVYVSNPATEGIQRLRWDWLTSTTGSHSKQVEEFKQIIEALEAKNNPGQYENLVSAFDVPTKQAFDATVREYNITVPSSTTDLPNEINGFGQQEKIPNINPTVSSPEESLKKEVQNVNTDTSFSLEQVSESININNLNKNDVDSSLKQYSTSEKEKIVNTSIDSSSEQVKGLIGEELILVNGKPIKTKKFLELLYKTEQTEELDFYIKMLPPEVSEAMKKEITLKLAYDFYKDYKGLSETKVISERMGTIDKFEEYLVFNVDQLKSEEIKLTGGEHSYLDIDFSA